MPIQQRGVREIGREIAFLSLYIYDTGMIPLPDILDYRWYDQMAQFFDENGELVKIPASSRKWVFEFASRMVNGTICNLPRIDKVIEAHLVKWSFARLHAVDKAVMRISVYSLLYQYDIPIEVVIAEANELSDTYGDDNAAHYINGILNNVKNEARKNPLLPEPEKKKETATNPAEKKKVVMKMKKKKGKG
jgi:transcription antitermination protein NusB